MRQITTIGYFARKKGGRGLLLRARHEQTSVPKWRRGLEKFGNRCISIWVVNLQITVTSYINA